MALVCCGSLASPAAFLSAVAQSQSPTADKTVFDFSKFNDETLVPLFKKALDNGRKYPTAAEFEAAGILPSDIAFVRSHVRRAAILPRTDRLVGETYETRNLWMNIPMDVGKDGEVGYPDGDFGSDVFSMWQYTNLFGSWNHGFFQAPGAWVDAAHKNGTDIMSGIKFFDTTGGRGEGANDWMTFCTEKNSDGTFAYVKPIINCLMYFGADGINFNWEATGYNDEDIIAFHKALYKEAEAQGFDNFHLGLYTSVSTLTSANANGLYGDNTGQTADLMLNYSAGDFSYGLSPSAIAAQNATGSTDRLYSGVWIVSMDRAWNRLDADANAHKVGLCLWGEHAQSRFFSYNTGSDVYETQANYQRLLERGFSGGNRNPAKRPAVSASGNNWEADASGNPALSTFCGLAQFIPERSAIQGNLPFETFFNLGNGDRYNYKGKKTGAAWYNMANQDRVPTYRWLVYNAGTETVSDAIQPEFSHADSYTGGSCLELSGKATSTGTDIVLYKTQLNVSAGSPVAKVAVKNGKSGVNASSLYVIVRRQSDKKWLEFPVGDLTGTTWEEKTVDMSALATGDVIDRIGLRVKGSDDSYKMYVGQLRIADGFKANPAAVKDLVAEVKGETKTSMSLKLNWGVEATGTTRADWGLVYNDEANIDHFEVLYKVGENGRVSEVGRTTQWATYVNGISFENTADVPYVGVRSVSTDLTSCSPIVWVRVDRADQSLLPDAEKEGYGTIVVDPSSDGVDIARVQRYLTEVKTTGADQNLSYTASAPQPDGTQYVDATSNVLKVKQGQKITLFFKAANNSDGLKWCRTRAWMDFDGDRSFNTTLLTENPSEGECLYELGKVRAGTEEFQTTGVSVDITIPEDARTGESCLRMVFNDAWFDGSLVPVGKHNKGFAIDFGVEISGTNAQRPVPGDIHDQGTADEPDNLVSGISSVQNGNAVSSAEVTDGAIKFANVEKAWVYGADGKLVKFVTGSPASLSTLGFAAGTYVVKMQHDNVIRSQKVAVK